MLTLKQKKFVEVYSATSNATQAAIEAGYSKKTAYSAGGRLLKDVEVKKAIEKRQEKAVAKLEITPEYIIGGLIETIEVCQGKRKVPDKDGTPIFKPDPGVAVKGMQLLGSTLKMWTDRIEQTVNLSVHEQALKELMEDKQSES